jgi:hypothetical protein
MKSLFIKPDNPCFYTCFSSLFTRLGVVTTPLHSVMSLRRLRSSMIQCWNTTPPPLERKHQEAKGFFQEAKGFFSVLCSTLSANP